MYSVRSCCAVSGMNILLSGPLVETPELLCQSYYFIYSLCVSGGGGPFSKFLRFLRGAPLCGDTSIISIYGSGVSEVCLGAPCLEAP